MHQIATLVSKNMDFVLKRVTDPYEFRCQVTM